MGRASGWPDDDGRSALGSVNGVIEGLPRAAELVAHYGERSARSLDAIDWYVVLACYRLGIILEGTHARACSGRADRQVGDLLHATTVALFERALGRI